MRWKHTTVAIIGFVAPVALMTFGAFCGARYVNAQDRSVSQSQSVKQGSPVLKQAEHYDLSPPLSSLPSAPRQKGRRADDVESSPRPFSPGADDSAVHLSAPAALAPFPSTNFNGLGQGFSGPSGTFSVTSAPPDPNGDIGPNHYVQVVNADFAIFSKNGIVILGPIPINTLWSGFGGGCETNNDGQPIVVYDPMADRWVISQVAVTTTPFLQCVAVSQTADPTGTYFRYSYQYADRPDSPKMGVWPDGYYTTSNMFNPLSASQSGQVCAYERGKMLAGQAARQLCFNVGSSFRGLLPSDLDGSLMPTQGSPNYIVALGAAPNELAYWKFHVDWTVLTNSSLTGPDGILTAPFSEACSGGAACIPQAGTTNQLDAVGDRLMYRLSFRNFGDHESLVVNHSVASASSVGVRWYELRPFDGVLTIFQQGTYAPDSNYRWMGSIAMDKSGNMALGFSLSGDNLHPEIRYTGRLAGSAQGEMDQGEGILIAGGSQTGTLHSWGHYSMMAVDPTDDCTFWYTSEYIPTDGSLNWTTRISSFKFPSCGSADDFVISAQPTSLTLVQGTSGSSTISTAVARGSAQTVGLNISGIPNGATGVFNPPSVTAGGSSTLDINTGNAMPGTYLLTIIGKSGATTHTTSVTLVVTAANNFSISVSPASLSLEQTTSRTPTISTAVVFGGAESINLSVSGVPSGATASFNPTSITTGSNSTLTINSGAAAAGTYTLIITGTSASASRSTGLQLTITSDPIVLSKGVAVTNLSGPLGSQRFFKLTVPAGKSTLTFTMSGGTGDADHYVRFGVMPTLSSYDCRPYTVGNNEQCTFNNPSAGDWYVMIHGYSVYTGVTLVGDYSDPVPDPYLTNNVEVIGISGATGSQKFWRLAVPAGRSSVTFTIKGGAGDADLYVRRGARPTTSSYDCRSFNAGNNEQCTFTNPQADDWYVTIKGYSQYSGVRLKGVY